MVEIRSVETCSEAISSSNNQDSNHITLPGLFYEGQTFVPRLFYTGYPAGVTVYPRILAVSLHKDDLPLASLRLHTYPHASYSKVSLTLSIIRHRCVWCPKCTREVIFSTQNISVPGRSRSLICIYPKSPTREGNFQNHLKIKAISGGSVHFS